MINFSRIIGFDWDAGNERKSADKHGVSQVEAEQAFFNDPVVVNPDTAHSGKEPRFHVLGKTNLYRLLHITFTLRQGGTKIRVISARDMNRKERNHYEEEN